MSWINSSRMEWEEKSLLCKLINRSVLWALSVRQGRTLVPLLLSPEAHSGGNSPQLFLQLLPAAAALLEISGWVIVNGIIWGLVCHPASWLLSKSMQFPLLLFCWSPSFQGEIMDGVESPVNSLSRKGASVWPESPSRAQWALGSRSQHNMIHSIWWSQLGFTEACSYIYTHTHTM